MLRHAVWMHSHWRGRVVKKLHWEAPPVVDSGEMVPLERGLVNTPLLPAAEMSTRGSKYIDAEVESAINGIKEMKVLMDKTGQDHQRILTALEDTRRKKEVSPWGVWVCDLLPYQPREFLPPPHKKRSPPVAPICKIRVF